MIFGLLLPLLPSGSQTSLEHLPLMTPEAPRALGSMFFGRKWVIYLKLFHSMLCTHTYNYIIIIYIYIHMIIYVHIFIYDIRMWLIAWAQTFPSWLMTPNDDKPGKNWLPVYRAEQMHHAQSSTVREMERLWHVHGSIWFLSDNYGKFAVRIFRTQMAILGLLGDIRWYYIYI
jgi:hypothetical protein